MPVCSGARPGLRTGSTSSPPSRPSRMRSPRARDRARCRCRGESVLRLGPLRLHWSLLLGAALFCALEPRPLLLLGYAAVLATHVLGHALAVAGTRLRVTGLMLH